MTYSKANLEVMAIKPLRVAHNSEPGKHVTTFHCARLTIYRFQMPS